MFKITKTDEDEKTINLRMDGKLVEEWLSEFEKLYLKIKKDKDKRIIIDLSGVSFIDDNGINFLEKIMGDSVDIINCSPFIESLLGGLINRDRVSQDRN